MRLNIGQEFVIGGFTSGNIGIDALVVGFYRGRSLMYAARVRAGLIPATRRDLYARLQPLTIRQCPFANLPEEKSGRWGEGLTAAKMKECVWVKPELVANCEFLEWTDTNHVRHIKFVSLRDDKDLGDHSKAAIRYHFKTGHRMAAIKCRNSGSTWPTLRLRTRRLSDTTSATS